MERTPRSLARRRRVRVIIGRDDTRSEDTPPEHSHADPRPDQQRAGHERQPQVRAGKREHPRRWTAGARHGGNRPAGRRNASRPLGEHDRTRGRGGRGRGCGIGDRRRLSGSGHRRNDGRHGSRGLWRTGEQREQPAQEQRQQPGDNREARATATSTAAATTAAWRARWRGRTGWRRRRTRWRRRERRHNPEVERDWLDRYPPTKTQHPRSPPSPLRRLGPYGPHLGCPNTPCNLDFTQTRHVSCSFKGPSIAYLFDTSHHPPDQSAGPGAAWYHLTAGGPVMRSASRPPARPL